MIESVIKRPFISGSFQDSESAEAVHFVRINADEKAADETEEGFDWPRQELLSDVICTILSRCKDFYN